MMRVLIVDDEEFARLRLRTLLLELTEPALRIVGEAPDVTSALDLLGREPADLVLLDIGLPGESGLQLAARFAAAPGAPAVVFVTAHAEHALTAFELDAADYLTKPVARQRLQAAVQRVAQRRALVPPPTVPALVVSDRGRVLRVPLTEVLYLKAEDKYVTLRTASRSHLLDDALADLEQRLGSGFLRIHRNAVVALSAVRELQRHAAPDSDGEGWAVRLAPADEWLAVSRRQLGAVRAAVRAALAGRA
jgi:two-component system, LytTR family, response regulator AlgR